MKKIISSLLAFCLLAMLACSTPVDSSSEHSHDLESSEGSQESSMPESQNLSTEPPAYENPDAKLSYEEYFAEDRVFKDEGAIMLSEISKYVDKDGALYLTKEPSKDPMLIWDGKDGLLKGVSDVDLIYDQLLFLVSGKTLMSCDIYGNNMEKYFEFDKEISSFMSNSEIVFFMADKTVYRLHRQSMKLEEAYFNPEMVNFWVSYSNVIVYSLPNPEWKDEYFDSNPNYSDTISYYYNIATKEDREYNDEIHEKWIEDAQKWRDTWSSEESQKNN